MPYFFISTHPVGWKCSVCGQIFRVPLNVLDKPSSKPDNELQSRFEAHSCLAHRDKVQKRRETTGAAQAADENEPTY